MGRKRKSGPRGKTGRLKAVWDYGNERTQARAAQFRVFGGESSTGHEMTCAGRLMLVGAFDGMDEPPETVLSALLEYANGYWGYYRGGAKIAAYERADRSNDNSDDTTPDPSGEWFGEMDRRLRNAGHAARRAVHEVSVDRLWFPDEDSTWAARIINTRFVEKRLPVTGELACDSDYAMLDLLRIGAAALIGTRLKEAA